MGAAKKIRFLTNPTEVKLTVRAAAVLLASPVLLKRYDIQKTVDFLTPRRRVKPKKQLSHERVIYLCQRVLNGFARVAFRSNCLKRSLTMYHCLKRHGAAVDIHFGVKMGDEELQGHCWLMVDNQLVGDSEEMVGQFAPMFSLPHSETTNGDGSEIWRTIEKLDKLSFDD